MDESGAVPRPRCVPPRLSRFRLSTRCHDFDWPSRNRSPQSCGPLLSFSLPPTTASYVLRVIHDMRSYIHALVQDAHYEHTLALRYVKHDVRSIFTARPASRAGRPRRPAHTCRDGQRTRPQPVHDPVTYVGPTGNAGRAARRRRGTGIDLQQRQPSPAGGREIAADPRGSCNVFRESECRFDWLSGLTGQCQSLALLTPGAGATRHSDRA